MRLVLTLFLPFPLTIFSYNDTPSPQQYMIVDLGVDPGCRGIRATAINDSAKVGRYWHSPVSADAHDRLTFFWEGGTLTEVGTLGGFNSEARDISKHGFVVGTAQTSAGKIIFANQPNFAGTSRANGSYSTRDGDAEVGAWGVGRGRVHAFVHYRDRTISPPPRTFTFRDLGTFPGTNPAETDGEAVVVNVNAAVTLIL